MQLYIGTKLIKAKPMTQHEYCQLRGWDKPDEEDEPGYLVEYTDGGRPNEAGFKGYISWSPKGVFDNANRPVNAMSFGHALEAMKKGMAVRLPHWELDVFIRAQYPDENSKMTAPYLYVQSRYGNVPWKETMIELFSDEWIVLVSD